MVHCKLRADSDYSNLCLLINYRGFDRDPGSNITQRREVGGQHLLCPRLDTRWSKYFEKMYIR